MRETIGVVIGTFNGEHFIKEQIGSILNQTLKPNLIVVVDDKSTDKTPEIVKNYSLKYNNIKFYQNERNIGWIRNFEQGISLCNTDYIALSDQDDIWFPNKLEKCFQKMSSVCNSGLCYHNSELIYEDGKRLGTTLWELSDLNYPMSKREARLIIANTQTPISGFTMFFHSDLKEHILPIPGERYCPHDWWICAVSFFLYNPVYLESPLSYYRMHPKQASGANACMLKNTKYEIKKKVFDLDRIRRNLRRIVYRLFWSRKIKSERQEDEKKRKKEFAGALERLIEIIEDNSYNTELNETEEKIRTLSDERRRLLSDEL